jgi:chemotaxis protein MotB
MRLFARWHSTERSSGHGGGAGSRWLVSYADFVTLMFGFFLILWASANQDPTKLAALAEAFQRAFNSGAMTGQPNAGQILGTGGRAAPMEVSNFQRVSETVGEMVAQMSLEDQASIGMRRDGLVITLSSSLTYEPGTAELTPKAKEILGRMAPSIEAAQGEVRVEGHTDNVSPRPQFPSNWELSNARAAAVARYFTETLGLPAEKFQVAGYAEFRPLYPNDTRENRSRNRRVEIVLMTAQGSSASPAPPAPAKPAAEAVKPTEAPKPSGAAPAPAKPADAAKPAGAAPAPAKPAEAPAKAPAPAKAEAH